MEKYAHNATYVMRENAHMYYKKIFAIIESLSAV
jgi:hypothetical protein